jgi:hypothetical protein
MKGLMGIMRQQAVFLVAARVRGQSLPLRQAQGKL